MIRVELARLFGQEYKEFGDKLFRHARFKGGGSGGGGSQSTQTIQKADPWSGQQPYLTSGYEAAKSRLGSEQPQFYPGSTISPFNQNELAAQQAMLDYSSGSRPQAMQMGAESALTGEMLANPYTNPVFAATRGLPALGLAGLPAAQGFTGTATGTPYGDNPVMQQMLSGSAMDNPFIAPALAASTQEAVQNFQQQVMPGIRSSQIQYQPGGSSRGDIVTGMAGSGLAQQLANNATKAYMDAQNQAIGQQQFGLGLAEQGRAARAGEALQQFGGAMAPALQGEQAISQRLGGGMGAYPGVMEAPLGMPQRVADIGMAQRQMSQQQLDESQDRYNFEQNVEAQKLANYMNLIQGNVFGGQTTTQSTRGGMGLGGQIGQGLSTAALMAGLMGG